MKCGINSWRWKAVSVSWARNGQVRDLTRYIYRVFQPKAVSTAPYTNSSFAVHTQTNSSITLRPLSPTYLHTATSADANRSVNLYPLLCHPCQTTTITSAIPNGGLHISLRRRSRRPGRSLTISITANNEQLWICVDCKCWRSCRAVSTRIRCRPSCALPATTSIRSAAGADWRQLVAPRDNPHTEGRRVLARHHVNDTQSHWENSPHLPTSLSPYPSAMKTSVQMVPTTWKKRIASTGRLAT